MPSNPKQRALGNTAPIGSQADKAWLPHHQFMADGSVGLCPAGVPGWSHRLDEKPFEELKAQRNARRGS